MKSFLEAPTKTKTKTFSEMLHGDILWMKQQETVRRMHRMGKTEMVLLDPEAGVSRMTPSHYVARQMLVDALTAGMGFKGMQAKRKTWANWKVVSEINKRHPALAAEHRVGGKQGTVSIADMMKRRREQEKLYRDLNWGYFFGRGAR